MSQDTPGPVTAPAVPAAVPTPAPAAPPARLNAIQLIEHEIADFIRQREQAIANVHAIDGAIQGSQRILAKLREAAALAEAEAKKLLGEAKTDVKDAEQDVKTDVAKAESAVVSEVEKVEKAL